MVDASWDNGSYYKAFNEARNDPIAALLGTLLWHRCIAWTSGLHGHSSLRRPRADTRGALRSHAYSGRQSVLTNGQEERGVQTVGTRHFTTHTVR